MKLKDVAQRLPQELFMQIAERLLEAVGSERYTSVLSGMALVCRAWDQLCRPRRLQLVRILWMADFKRSCDIFAQSSARTSLVKTLQVGPIDTPLSGTDKAPSLELLLSSALVYSMRNIQTISWNALDLGSASPMAGVTLQCPVPPRIHAALPALLRPLAQLTTLRISNKTFKSLGLLLRALHAPRALHTLILENVRVPPLVGQLRWPISGWSTLRRIELRRSFVPIEAVGMIVQLVFSPQELLAHLNTTLQSANDQPTMPEQIITVVAKIFRVLVASYFTNQNGVSLDITTMPACEQGMPGVCTDFTLLDVHQSEQKVLLKCSLYISSAHVPVRSNRTLIRVTSTFYRGFAPTPLVEDHSFRTLLMDLDSTIFGFAETYTRELRIATDLQCILRFHGLYHVRVDELRTAIPQLMPQIGSRGRIQVGSAAPSTSGSTVAKSAAKSPVLPSSLVQRIIDHLDAHHSLHTASLVCRSWVPLASPHLLRRVTLYCTKRLDWSMRYDKREQTWHWHQGFFKLADQSARLRRHVREIAIAISSSPIPTSVIGCIISTFSHLEYLYLPGNIHPTSGPPMAATPVKFCGTLHLSRCSTLTLLASILPGLSSVRCLHLTQTYQGSRHVMPQLVPFSMASIQELILQDICDIHLLFGLPPTAFKKLTLIGVQDWAKLGLSIDQPGMQGLRVRVGLPLILAHSPRALGTYDSS
ncbi:uncharacterized protein PHACADRAFT_212505 [Phanerochaete carnosa HHB-10118-sp]|uniref:F-box domain-containing protein n=1 Tax=Phanerochaete carnosa (strain HHB-10118-sp) TaxID=650164 RepID=K5WNK5_PHACS|nr:uncharacterized protein PHACADRAFT_212505 [Phanerochaete carnosa HHB-10118-sp]EKM51887.1 hypothetical protein PHACADRAFT_212505 [Phanerochaete carnosa HHB-10118-sp]